MLFQRLYNWIKFKTLPSSFLFKNRLFIERDSKHRRVFSNFGLSFRNSKWSNYENYNIKLHFKNFYITYLLYILLFLSLFIFFIYFKQYYIFSYLFNSLSFFFWISIDSFDYYLSFLIWIFGSIVSIMFNFIYSYFFFKNTSQMPQNKEIFDSLIFKNLFRNYSLINNDNFISKHDLNWILYSWLTNPSSIKNDKVLENIFESKINSNLWASHYDFFINIYKLSNLLQISSSNSSSLYIKNKISNLINNYSNVNSNNIINFFNNDINLNNFYSIVTYYILNNYNNYFSLKNKNNKSVSFINNRYEWNLYNFSNEINSNSLFLKNKIGFFFINDVNYEKLSNFLFSFNELWIINSSLKNQLNSSKWNRWLYRYSILHRKILKNSHKITLSKKLINSGFYDSNLFNKNIWASEHFSNIKSLETLNSFFNIYYGNVFNLNLPQFLNYKMLENNTNQKVSLNFLNFYENSYFWYLKRFYLLNTIPSNFIKSSSMTKSQNFKFSNSLTNYDNFNHYKSLLSYSLKSSFINLKSFKYSNNLLSLNNTYFNSSQDKKFHNNFYDFKDIYVLNNEVDLLSKDNLNLFLWSTLSSSLNPNLPIFCYFENNTDNFNYTFLNFINSNSNSVDSTSIINKAIVLSYIDIDKFFLNDLAYFSLFIN